MKIEIGFRRDSKDTSSLIIRTNEYGEALSILTLNNDRQEIVESILAQVVAYANNETLRKILDLYGYKQTNDKPTKENRMSKVIEVK